MANAANLPIRSRSAAAAAEGIDKMALIRPETRRAEAGRQQRALTYRERTVLTPEAELARGSRQLAIEE